MPRECQIFLPLHHLAENFWTLCGFENSRCRDDNRKFWNQANRMFGMTANIQNTDENNG